MGSMSASKCPACGRPRGTSAECLSCREAAARDLARVARDVTPSDGPVRAGTSGGFVRRTPWYARSARAGRREKLRLLSMVLRDYLDGSYRKMPLKAAVAVAAAAAYLVSPLDLIPDALLPSGWADDLLPVALTFGLVKRELRDYCAWKGLSPSHFGL